MKATQLQALSVEQLDALDGAQQAALTMKQYLTLDAVHQDALDITLVGIGG